VNKVTIVDYGVGNLLSVSRAFEHLGAAVTVSSDPAAIAAAERLVLPGVGAFGAGMAELTQRGLVEPVQAFAASGRPFLGICLGMQMMLSESEEFSEEFGTHRGLGLIPGKVVELSRTTPAGESRKIPHIGWSALAPAHDGAWAGTALEVVEPGRFVYFVHSFMAQPDDPAHLLAQCLYGGAPVVAAVGRDNLLGCQFHPEKSGTVGLAILARFLEL
jgi:glutamine amidotransferase